MARALMHTSSGKQILFQEATISKVRDVLTFRPDSSETTDPWCWFSLDDDYRDWTIVSIELNGSELLAETMAAAEYTNGLPAFWDLLAPLLRNGFKSLQVTLQELFDVSVSSHGHCMGPVVFATTGGSNNASNRWRLRTPEGLWHPRPPVWGDRPFEAKLRLVRGSYVLVAGPKDHEVKIPFEVGNQLNLF